MNDNNKLIPLQQNSLIPKVTNTLNITNKLIFENNRKLVKEIFGRNPKLFIDLISEFYPLNKELLEKHENKLNWKKVSKNYKVLWSIELIEKFENNWDWYSLSTNNSLPYFIELEEKYKGKFYYVTEDSIPCLAKKPWTMDFFEENKNKYDWDYICANEHLPWSIELIKKYESEWNWLCLSKNQYIPFSMKLIHKYAEKWSASCQIWRILESFVNDYMVEEFLEKTENKP